MDSPDEIIHVLYESFFTVVCEVITLGFIGIIASCACVSVCLLIISHLFCFLLPKKFYVLCEVWVHDNMVRTQKNFYTLFSENIYWLCFFFVNIQKIQAKMANLFFCLFKIKIKKGGKKYFI